MRILIINDHGIVGGGTETRIGIFIKMLLEDPSTEVHVLQPKLDDKEISPFFHERLTIHHYDAGAYKAYKAAKEIIAVHKIDLVQSHHLLLIGPYVLLAAKEADIPIVWWAHDYWLLCTKRSFIDPYRASEDTLCERSMGKACHRCMPLKTRIKHALWKRLINISVCAIAPAKILQDIHEAAGVLEGKWHVVTPWIDPVFTVQEKVDREEMGKEVKEGEINDSEETKKQKLLFVGSLIEFKGGWVAAKAMKKIVASFPNTELVFVGSEQDLDNRFRQKIDAICKEDGTSDHVVFLGRKNKKEIAALHKESIAYLCPTVCMESFGLNWAEAMASGNCVIASAVGSIPEYIKDGENGLLFAAKDHNGLANAVVKLLSDNDLREKIAAQGKEYAQIRFTGRRAVEEIKEIYGRILGK
jgi:glycosyltransferase involved in cell wall biosynthesis